MSVGEILIELQNLDLAIVRDKAQLEQMPELKNLAIKRKTYAKVKSEVNKIIAQRKDCDIELEDLDIQEKRVNFGVAAAQKQAGDTTDYRQVQDLERQLSNFAKEMDKIEYGRKCATKAKEEALAKEAKALELKASFEKELLQEANDVKDKASKLQADIQTCQKRRDALANQLTEDMRKEYTDLYGRFGGIPVEHLDGDTPSVCHTKLQVSSLDALKHAKSVTHCPYCGRILVIDRNSEEE